MVNGFQKDSLSTRLKIPMMYGIDDVHGHNNVYKATIFPHNVGLGAIRDPKLEKRIDVVTALEVRATGIPYAFAPCIADDERDNCNTQSSFKRMDCRITEGCVFSIDSGWCR